MIEGIENAYPNYGLPKKKKYPLPDRKHVLSAIRFFNYVSPQDEKQLAEAILEKIKEYGMKDVGVGPDNRFLKYYKKDADHLQHHGVKGQQWGVHNGSSYPIRPGYVIKFNKGVGIEMNDYKIVRNDDCLQHHGIPGQKWGVRRFQNEDGSLTSDGRLRYGSKEQRGSFEMDERGQKIMRKRLESGLKNLESLDTSKYLSKYENESKRKADKYVKKAQKYEKKRLEANQFQSDGEDPWFRDMENNYRKKMESKRDKYEKKAKKALDLQKDYAKEKKMIDDYIRDAHQVLAAIDTGTVSNAKDVVTRLLKSDWY